MNKLVEPFATLTEIAQRSLAAARGLPAQQEVKVTWSGVGFTLGGVKMVAPMAEVAEMLVELGATKMPGVQPWVKGVANVRGRLLPLVDLYHFFNHKPLPQSRDRRVLVVERGELYTGLVVDRVFGMQHFPAETFTDEIAEDAAAYGEYLVGSYLVDGEPWAVFSPFLLAADTRFVNAAAS
ncbi:twitching motility protein PilI [Sinobacterium caligoides]|uniref:Twitching motility protein PilI n=1 Tax=Sinobacterium caligoides TaxID=933926 RepID=A0A3N2DGQ3_9GAMM|nr:chemotaxis protein CheW [Sinobacterium caligoides]ROR98921.1 twitching motility protein PilI [Sinobacterium caligoides]